MGESMRYTIKNIFMSGEVVCYECPTCREQLQNPLEDAGIKETCPVCKAMFTVPGPEAKIGSDDTFVYYKCSSCGIALKSYRKDIGSKDKCPKCKKSYFVPDYAITLPNPSDTSTNAHDNSESGNQNTDKEETIQHKITKDYFGHEIICYACLSCHRELNSPLTDAGRKDACPVCGKEFIVPGVEEKIAIEKAKAENEALIRATLLHPSSKEVVNKHLPSQKTDTHINVPKLDDSMNVPTIPEKDNGNSQDKDNDKHITVSTPVVNKNNSKTHCDFCGMPITNTTYKCGHCGEIVNLRNSSISTQNTEHNNVMLSDVSETSEIILAIVMGIALLAITICLHFVLIDNISQLSLKLSNMSQDTYTSIDSINRASEYQKNLNSLNALYYPSISLISAPVFGLLNALIAKAKRRSILGAFFLSILIGVFVFLYLLAVPPKESAPASSDHKTKICPYCAETILAAAILCKHCGKELAAQ